MGKRDDRSFSPGEAKDEYQANLISDIIVGEPVAMWQVGLSVVSTLIFALGFVWLAVWLYRRERILG